MKLQFYSITLLFCVTTSQAFDEVPYARLSSESLELVGYELRTALGDLACSPQVKGTLAALTLLSAGYVYYRLSDEQQPKEPARTRYRGLLRKKSEIDDIAAMSHSLGIPYDRRRQIASIPSEEEEGRPTRFLSLSDVGALLPHIVVSDKDGEERKTLEVTSSFAKGALVGGLASVTIFMVLYGKALRNGLLLEKAGSMFGGGTLTKSYEVVTGILPYLSLFSLGSLLSVIKEKLAFFSKPIEVE